MSTVAQQIDAQAPNAMVRLAMRLGALLEGGSLGGGPFPTGDQGTSPGPFQIHLPAHPGVSVGQAQDPAFAVRFMLPSYTSAAAHIPASVWSANPELAAEQTAFHAERPAQDYFTARGQQTVDTAFKTASGGGAPSPGAAQLAAASGTGGSSPPNTTDSGATTDNAGCQSPSGLGALINAPGWVKYFFCRLEQDAKPALFETAAVLTGTGLVVAGLWRSVSRSQTFQTAKAAAQSSPGDGGGGGAGGGGMAKVAEMGAVA